MILSRNLRLLTLVAILSVCSRFAFGQVSSGSIVVFALQQDKFSVAADSETTPSDQPGSKRYEQCKILALDHSTLFAAAGFMDYTRIDRNDKMQSWSAFDIARQSVKAVPNGNLGSIADEWANQMKTRLEAIGARRINAFSSSHNDNIANGVFATAKDGSISVTTRNLKLVNGTFQIESGDCPDGALGAAGELTVFRELTGDAPRTLTKSDPDWPPDASTKRDVTALVRVASLTAKWDSSGYVGGSIDVVELWHDGTIHWISQKPQCVHAQ
jgi:hypothetical protein